MDSLSSDIVIIHFVELYTSVPLHLLCVSLLVLCLWESVCVSLCVVDPSDYKSCCERTSKSPLVFSRPLFHCSLSVLVTLKTSFIAEGSEISASEAVLSRNIKPANSARATRQRGEGHAQLNSMIWMLGLCVSINRN